VETKQLTGKQLINDRKKPLKKLILQGVDKRETISYNTERLYRFT